MMSIDCIVLSFANFFLITCVFSLQNTNVDDGAGFINDLPLLKSEYSEYEPIT
jgi:hypothetical protein